MEQSKLKRYLQQKFYLDTGKLIADENAAEQIYLPL